ncbi:lipid II:glycine glycyltransferase FemX [Ornithinimicrobium kibberense]|uniref:Lipid II:glycine glycyltransferase FemX n=1 Tax=Ornithinimicrobium kibberense TaxID=282060 RepID=A0ABV5V133_9MICO|nr:peptidoglycan bridge formation glycyltransferase FemA/FemB family protein [Ornithinimicrobium kibberense]
MTLRHATAQETADWDELVRASPGGMDLMQLPPYATIKAGAWARHHLMVHEHPGRPAVPALYLVKKVPPFGELWYAPMGPRVTEPEHVRAVCEDLRTVGAFAVILEPPVPADGPRARSELVADVPGLEEFLDLQQGHHTVLLDLRPTEDELLASFRQRARRSIRKSADAVIEHRTDDAAIEAFWQLYAPTVERAGFPLRPKDYYVTAWRLYRDLGQGHVVLARSSADVAEPEAAAFIWKHGHLGYYRDGGSVRTPSANGLQYRVQWESIRWCKEHGATTYDLYGAPPSWQADDPDHQLHGLVQFKTAFGPITDTVGTTRLVLDRRRTAAWDRFGRRVYARLTRARNPLFY